MSSKTREKKLELELSGKTLKVYLYILRRGKPVGVSEIQRALGFRNPSLASYYLDKLIDLGLVKKDERGSYFLSKSVKVGVLTQFVRIGRLMLPRYLFYASFMTSMLITYLFLFHGSLDPYVIVFGVAACIILWFETLKLWFEKPF